MNPGDIRRKRIPAEPAPALEDPRDPPWADLIAAERQRLVQEADGGRGPSDRTVRSEARTAPAGLDTLAYRYTRGLELTNDEMGYGEEITEELWYFDGKSLTKLKRKSRRTKTGRQFLESTGATPGSRANRRR